MTNCYYIVKDGQGNVIGRYDYRDEAISFAEECFDEDTSVEAVEVELTDDGLEEVINAETIWSTTSQELEALLKDTKQSELTEDTHNKYAKPEGDRVAAFNNALKYAKKDNTAYIYGYTNHEGKFFALDRPMKLQSESAFRQQYKNSKVIYVAYPDKDFITESKDVPVVSCEVTDVITHSEDEKPVDCKGEKKPLEKPLTEEAGPVENPDE